MEAEKNNQEEKTKNRQLKQAARDELIFQYESGEPVFWGDKLVETMKIGQIRSAIQLLSTQYGSAWREIFKKEISKRKTK